MGDSSEEKEKQYRFPWETEKDDGSDSEDGSCNRDRECGFHQKEGESAASKESLENSSPDALQSRGEARNSETNGRGESALVQPPPFAVPTESVTVNVESPSLKSRSKDERSTTVTSKEKEPEKSSVKDWDEQIVRKMDSISQTARRRRNDVHPQKISVVEINQGDVVRGTRSIDHAPERPSQFDQGIQKPGELAKRKNQLSYLLWKAKDSEQELNQRRYEAKKNKAETRSKYGWK